MPATFFIFLEITDPAISSLLWHMQWILSGTEPRLPAHITLRGPYRNGIKSKDLDAYRENLQHDTLRIGGVGRFTNPDQEVVFLRVASPNLRKVSWKPNYPKKHGFNPHISLYRGRDAAFADRATGFLEHESLELFCTSHRLVVHKRGSLPFPVERPAAFSAASWPAEAGSVDPELLPRLRQFVDEYRDAATASGENLKVTAAVAER